MDFILPIKALLLITLVQAIAAGLQGVVGYGMALLSGPVLLLFEPRLMPGSFLLSSISLSILVVLRERRELVIGDLGWAISGHIPGSLLASVLLTLFAAAAFNYTFGILILLAVLLSISGLKLSPTRVNLFIAGLFSGVMGTIAAIGGPPIAIVYQGAAGGRMRTNLAVFFIFGTLISLASLMLAGKMGLQEVLLSINLLPGIFIGYFLSNYLVKLFKPHWLRSAVLGVAAVSAVVIIVRQIVTG
jgi:uncharacterized protein